MAGISRFWKCCRAAAAAVACLLPGGACAGSAWAVFLSKYSSPEGRVVDTGNGGISHSEGQGYGMILATAYGDRKAFDRIWGWTRRHLQVRDDALLAWKWESRGKSGGAVTDMNNATDGDILVAWALFRAAKLWDADGYREQARAMLSDILAKTVVPSSFGPLVLPGAEGFSSEDGTVVNLSYWVFPAFRTFAKEDPATDWMAISASGMRLLGSAKFGRWGLPPDWLLVQGTKVDLPKEFPPEFGYNAIRIPLHLVWDGETAAEWFAGYRAYAGFFHSISEARSTVNLVTNVPGPNPVLPGMERVYALVGASGPAASAAPKAMGSPAKEPYFSAALSLLVQLAYKEGVKTKVAGNGSGTTN